MDSQNDRHVVDLIQKAVKDGNTDRVETAVKEILDSGSGFFSEKPYEMAAKHGLSELCLFFARRGLPRGRASNLTLENGYISNALNLFLKGQYDDECDHAEVGAEPRSNEMTPASAGVSTDALEEEPPAPPPAGIVHSSRDAALEKDPLARSAAVVLRSSREVLMARAAEVMAKAAEAAAAKNMYPDEDHPALDDRAAVPLTFSWIGGRFPGRAAQSENFEIRGEDFHGVDVAGAWFQHYGVDSDYERDSVDDQVHDMEM